MNETVQNAADSAVAPAPAAAPVAEEAVQQPAIVASEPAAKVKGKFDEQLGLMLPSDAAQVQAQLSMPGMSDDMVYKIVETHGGNHAVLYKTYDQAVLARDVRDSIENAAGHKVLPIAKAKLGTTYCKGEYSTEQGCKGESDTFGIGSLVEFQATGLIVVMCVIVGLTVLCYLMNFIMAKLGLNKVKAPAPAVKAAPAAAPAAKAAAAPAGGFQVKSPLPGSVIKVVVSEGQAVKKGDTLLTLESMKMENAIMAEVDGTVKQIAVTPGQNVMQDDLLIVLG
jgi:biotin carboxyl carrier protein